MPYWDVGKGTTKQSYDAGKTGDHRSKAKDNREKYIATQYNKPKKKYTPPPGEKGGPGYVPPPPKKDDGGWKIVDEPAPPKDQQLTRPKISKRRYPPYL